MLPFTDLVRVRLSRIWSQRDRTCVVVEAGSVLVAVVARVVDHDDDGHRQVDSHRVDVDEAEEAHQGEHMSSPKTWR